MAADRPVALAATFFLVGLGGFIAALRRSSAIWAGVFCGVVVTALGLVVPTGRASGVGSGVESQATARRTRVVAGTRRWVKVEERMGGRLFVEGVRRQEAR